MTPETLNDYCRKTLLNAEIKAQAAANTADRSANAKNAEVAVEAARHSADWASQTAALANGMHQLIVRWHGGSEEYHFLKAAMKHAKQALGNAQSAMGFALEKVQHELEEAERVDGSAASPTEAHPVEG